MAKYAARAKAPKRTRSFARRSQRRMLWECIRAWRLRQRKVDRGPFLLGRRGSALGCFRGRRTRDLRLRSLFVLLDRIADQGAQDVVALDVTDESLHVLVHRRIDEQGAQR